jgi:ParB-like chromosome segregation protein Spo0J
MNDIMAFDESRCSAEGRAVIKVALSDLSPGVRLRHGTINRDHLNAMALSDGDWPPILVRRADNTIVDGHYRYLAASQLGKSHVDCTYFDGGEESAFLEALRQNTFHGLPLSLSDREAAARQILVLHLDWSDRRIGATCGLAPGTVGRIRTDVAGQGADDGQLRARVGRDGRRRPVDPRATRNRIVSVLSDQPNGSLRDVARMAGASPATVWAVKRQQKLGATKPKNPSGRPAALRSTGWSSDAAVLSATHGKSFARWFERTSVGGEWVDFASGIPVSRIYQVADEARRRATEWLEFASAVEARVRNPQAVSASTIKVQRKGSPSLRSDCHHPSPIERLTGTGLSGAD